jgi:hypothetical protein
VEQNHPHLLNYAEAARFLGIASGTLKLWVHFSRYDVPYLKIGDLVRFRRNELEIWLNSRARGGNPSSQRRRRRTRSK